MGRELRVNAQDPKPHAPDSELPAPDIPNLASSKEEERKGGGAPLPAGKAAAAEAMYAGRQEAAALDDARQRLAG